MWVELFSVVAPVLLIAGIGWAWGRSTIAFDDETVSRLVLYVGAPSLIFHSLVTTQVERSSLLTIAGLAGAAIVAFAVSGAVLLLALRLPLHTFLGPVIFTNSGNLGLPLCLFAFGDRGLSLGVAFFTVSFVTHSVVGPAIYAGERSLRPIVQNPMAWAVLAALLVVAGELHPPLFFVRTTELLGALTIPLMLLTLGVSLSRLRPRDLRQSVQVSVLRLGLGIGVGWGLAELAGLEGTERGVFILECSTPVGVLNYVFALRYRRSPEAVAGAVLISTLASMVTIPLLLALLLP